MGTRAGRGISRALGIGVGTEGAMDNSRSRRGSNPGRLLLLEPRPRPEQIPRSIGKVLVLGSSVCL